MKIKLFVSKLLLLFALSGCASTPEFSEIPPKNTEIIDGYGQLIVYRNSYVGIIIIPTISVDGLVYSGCEINTVTVINLKPGIRRVMIGGAGYEIEILEGKRSYALCAQYRFEEVSETKASKEILSKHYQGTFTEK